MDEIDPLVGKSSNNSGSKIERVSQRFQVNLKFENEVSVAYRIVDLRPLGGQVIGARSSECGAVS